MAYLDNYLKARNENLAGRHKVKSRRLVKNERRRHIIDKLMDAMSDWRNSPFEYEGACRAGLRSALCLDGHNWNASDAEAEKLVAEALQLMGAERPSWEDGQREATAPDGTCVWCNGPVEPGDTGRYDRFCSSHCARSMQVNREGEWKQRLHSLARMAALTVRREGFEKVECLQCQRKFTPYNMDARGRRFCSMECAGIYRRTIPERNCLHCHTSFWSEFRDQKYCCNECKGKHMRKLKPRECAQCKTTFRPLDKDSKFCSVACRNAANASRPARFYCTCVWCGIPFWGKAANARFCSSSHKSMDWQQRAGRKNWKRPADNVIYLTAEIFDTWFKRAA